MRLQYDLDGALELELELIPRFVSKTNAIFKEQYRFIYTNKTHTSAAAS
jgi:hypothetical protein